MREEFKIALIMPTFVQGGMERVMSELSSYFVSQNLHVDIIFLVKHNPFYEIDSNISSVSMPPFSYKRNIVSKIIYKVRLLFFIRKKIKKLGSNYILSFGEGYNSFVLLSTLGLKTQVYISDRSSPLKELPLTLKLFQSWLYPKANGIFSQTSLSKETLFKNTGNKNITILPNPVKIIPSVEVKNENIILNIGRLVPEKDQLTLIRIFNEINAKDWKLFIVGDGPLRGELEKEVNDLKIEDRVKILGAKKDLSEIMSRSKIFAFTSISEGYPNALCEAMAFPLASISFDCDAGPRDIIDNGVNGFLIEKGNKKLYKKKLIELMDSEVIRNKFKKESIKIRDTNAIGRIAEQILNEFRNENPN